MTKNELFTILELIIVYYDQFEIDQKKVDAWHEVLQTCSFEKVKDRLLSFRICVNLSAKSFGSRCCRSGRFPCHS
ncbi:hypothetical protein J2S21_004228 [Peribacillus cavernae]|nr:hypothetical protein [Peribacillus cavernae]